MTTKVAVIAHSGKTLGGGLRELRSELRAQLTTAGIGDPIWYEVPKSRMAPKRVRRALAEGADLLFVWGGDGMVQRCVDAAVGSEVVLAIVPAGTANLFAANVGIPKDIPKAVSIGLAGQQRRFDVGRINGEHFAVMAGAGFDAWMIKSADGALKDRLGRAAYLLTGLRHLGRPPVQTKVRLDGDKWFAGDASCVLIGNMGKLMGGVAAFPEAAPDDGLLEIGIVTAKNRRQWSKALLRTATGNATASPFIDVARGSRFDVRFAERTPYELDGGDRKKVRRLKVEVVPGAVTICVPQERSTG